MNKRWAPSASALTLMLVIGPAASAHSHKHAAQDPEPKALELRVTPRAAQSPATIRVTATVERDPKNREITIVADSGSFFRSSSTELEGADAPKSYTRVFANLPPGTYDITAKVERNDGTELLDVVTLEVFGPR